MTSKMKIKTRGVRKQTEEKDLEEKRNVKEETRNREQTIDKEQIQ